jgi:two-component system chemotaxis response regulator CheB
VLVWILRLSHVPPLPADLSTALIPDGPHEVAPPDMKLEVGMAAMDSSEDNLWEMNEEGALRFRCHVGHAYTAATLVAQQSDSLEEALWAAVRAFEENTKLATRMAERARALADEDVEKRLTQRAETARRRADEVRALLQRMDATTEFSA